MKTHGYPDPKEFSTKPVIHSRWRIVIQAFDEKSARETVEKLKDIGLPCSLEWFSAMCDQETDENRGEVVLHREFHAVAFEPAAAE